MDARFAVILPVGPATEEIVRARDLLDSLQAYEAGNFTLVLVDDHAGARDLDREIAGEADYPRVVTTNPRRGRGSGWGSGAAAGTLAALQTVVGLPDDHDFVVKLDTDSLVIDAFSERVLEAFQRRREMGIMGAYQFSPASDRESSSAPALEKLLRQWAVWRRTPLGGTALQVGFLGRYGRIRNVIRRALLNGYRLGEHCSGGGYAMSMRAVRALETEGLLDDPLLWLKTPLGEDTVLSLCVQAVGFCIQQNEAEREVFGVKHLGLLAAPEELGRRGYAIIHSVKDHKEYREGQTRAYFRQMRSVARPGAASCRLR
ncbi:MAG: hypothetical protein JO015_21300 [Verrucomicrobia bacterium]|nr:hypothetical protein [Verrucomicrobiota bacterium]